MKWRILKEPGQGYRLQRSRLGWLWQNVHWDGRDYHFETLSHTGGHHDVKPSLFEAQLALSKIRRRRTESKRPKKPGKVVFNIND